MALYDERDPLDRPTTRWGGLPWGWLVAAAVFLVLGLLVATRSDTTRPPINADTPATPSAPVTPVPRAPAVPPATNPN
jgi:hypothetical protein